MQKVLENEDLYSQTPSHVTSTPIARPRASPAGNEVNFNFFSG